MIEGLRPLQKDGTEFTVGALYNLPKLEEVPEEYFVGLPAVKNQYDSDMCAAFSSCTVSELQEDVELSPEWVFAVAKEITGDPDEWGCDLKSVCKAHTKHGAIEKSEAPYSLENKEADFLRRIENWPDLKEKADKHKKRTYLLIKGPYDAYDDIRATLWCFRNERRGAIIGVSWNWPIEQEEITTFSDEGFGHALAVVGFTKKGLFIQNSGGVTAGRNGRHYLSREVINYFVDKYGAFMFVDEDRDQIEHMINNNIKVSDNWLVAIIKSLWSFLKLR